MKEVRIITIDDRGRIVIPKLIRRSLGLTTNSQLMLVADTETKEIKISPVGLKGDSIKFRITMKDEAGSLGKIATCLGSHGISLVYGEAVIMEKDKTAIWTVIAPKPEHFSFEELKKILKEEGDALDTEMLPLD